MLRTALCIVIVFFCSGSYLGVSVLCAMFVKGQKFTMNCNFFRNGKLHFSTRTLRMTKGKMRDREKEKGKENENSIYHNRT